MKYKYLKRNIPSYCHHISSRQNLANTKEANTSLLDNMKALADNKDHVQ